MKKKSSSHSNLIHQANNLLASIMLSVEIMIRSEARVSKKHLKSVLSDAKKMKKTLENLRPER